MIIKNRRTWKNTTKKHKVHPLKYAEPESLYDIQHIVARAKEEKMHIRAVGSGHSFSNVAVTQGYLLNLKRLNQLLELPEHKLKPGDYSNLVHAEAGMTIQKFNKKTERKGLCVSNMGGIDNQTLAGAISTGTHGTGLEQQAFHGMVQSILMVAGDGYTYRIEPSDGISDPDQYPPKESINLIQDNNAFYSALVSLGAMGVVYSYILKLEPMFWMKETKELAWWEDIEPSLRDGSLLTDEHGRSRYRGIMVQISPYKTPDQKRRCVVVRHQELDNKPQRSIADRFRNLSTRLGSLPVTYLITRALVKYFPRQVPRLIDRSLKSLKDRSYENKGHKVMYQGVEYLKTKAYDCEFAVPLKNNEYLDALNKIIDRANELADQHIVYQSSPFGLRFVAGSQAYISPDYNQAVCYIDTPFLIGTVGADEVLDQYQEIMVDYGVPHWGKIHNRVFRYPDKIRQWYTDIDIWLATRDQFDPENIFTNDFTYRLQESLQESLEKIPKETV